MNTVGVKADPESPLLALALWRWEPKYRLPCPDRLLPEVIPFYA